MKRHECLEAARKAVEERNVQHGKPEDTFEYIAGLWSAYLDQKLKARDVAEMMILFKIGRSMGGRCDDNFVDMCGYAACAAELAEREPDERLL